MNNYLTALKLKIFTLIFPSLFFLFSLNLERSSILITFFFKSEQSTTINFFIIFCIYCSFYISEIVKNDLYHYIFCKHACYCTGCIPPELGGLSSLQQLDLRTNQLTGTTMSPFYVSSSYYLFRSNMLFRFTLYIH